MIAISLINTNILIKLVAALFTISLFFDTSVPIIGVEVKGAKRWLDLHFFRLQPIEILKPLFILMTVKIRSERLTSLQSKIFY